MPTAPSTITALPTAPDPTTRVNFNTLAYAWSAALPTFRTELNSVASNVYANALEAEADASAADASRVAAAASANYVGPWSSLTGALAIPASVSHGGYVYMLLSNVADVTAHTPGVSASWQVLANNPVLLSVLTPTAAANVDALSVFTSAFDTYLIVGQGIKPASNDELRMRFGVAGAADSGSNYIAVSSETNSPQSSTSTSAMVGGANVLASGKGANFAAYIVNANDATNSKALQGKVIFQSGATPDYSMTGIHCAYFAANALSGVRFFWSGGANFSATGKIRIYGFNNA